MSKRHYANQSTVRLEYYTKYGEIWRLDNWIQNEFKRNKTTVYVPFYLDRYKRYSLEAEKLVVKLFGE